MEEILRIKDLCKSFGGVHATNHVSFDIYEGEILGLIGPNGSGKSTCVNLISGVYSADSGSILYNGQNILPYSIPKRSHLGIGRTFQSPKPFTGITVFDSVLTVALRKRSFKEAAAKAEETLELTRLLPYKDLRSEKLPIEKRKWLDMARVLATDPKIMMLDEVMAGLNPMEIDDSVELVKKINKSGVTILFIEHVMKAVMNLCQRIVVLNEGTLLCSGLPKDVVGDPRVIKAYLGEGYKDVASNE